jgi:NADH:ubiquinone oxidoreductase subunit 3 (subunit A)
MVLNPLSPPLAFLFYALLIGVLTGLGRVRAAPVPSMKTSTYASGEAAPTTLAIPGYRRFFVIALFFAVLHLGVLVLATSSLSSMAGIYLAGLTLILVVLVMG